MIRRRYGWIDLLQLVMLAPLAISLGSSGAKPIDLALSDLLLPIGILLFFAVVASGKGINRSHFTILVFSLVICLYFYFIAYLGAVGHNDFVLRIASSIRYMIPFAFTFLAYAVYRNFGGSFLDIMSGAAKASLLILLILLVSDVVFNVSFPSSRWGGKFFAIDVYGFPNSPAVFYTFYLVFLLWAFQIQPSLIYLLGIALCLVIILFTFSRAGWISAFVASVFLISISMKRDVRARKRYSLLFLVVIASVFVEFDRIGQMALPWAYKFDSVSGGDLTFSGRIAIWAQATGLITSRPIFGYGFEPFSNYVPGFDTPHQQYLEIAYKSGLVGLCLVLAFYIGLSWSLVKSLKLSGLSLGARSALHALLAIVLATFVSNFSQPSLSYSPLGNAITFYLSLKYFMLTDERPKASL